MSSLIKDRILKDKRGSNPVVGKESEDNIPNFLYPDSQPTSSSSLGESEGDANITSSASNSAPPKSALSSVSSSPQTML